MRKRLQRKLNRLEQRSHGREALDISSLVDVSFLLLIYFLVTSTLEPQEADLAMTMPGPPPIGENTYPVDNTRPLIEVSESGVIFFETEMLDSDLDRRQLLLLEDRLRTFSEASLLIDPTKGAGIDLDVADAVPGQRFIDVLNCLAEVGISDVRFIQ